jgi:hypothetical protein
MGIEAADCRAFAKLPPTGSINSQQTERRDVIRFLLVIRIVILKMLAAILRGKAKGRKGHEFGLLLTSADPR